MPPPRLAASATHHASPSLSSRPSLIPSLPVEARPVVDFTIGASAGVFAAAMTYPLDVLKTSVQMGGIRGTVLSGLPQHLSMVAGQQSIKFGVFTTLQRSAAPTQKASASASALQALAHGAVAGAVQGICLAALERWKTLRQVHGSRVPLPPLNGQVRFWTQGLGLCVARDCGFALTLFAMNCGSRELCADAGVDAEVSFAAAAVLSGGLAAALVTPFDMLRARQQASFEARTVRQVANDVYREHGIAGFARGGLLRFARSGAQYLITFHVVRALSDVVDRSMVFEEMRS